MPQPRAVDSASVSAKEAGMRFQISKLDFFYGAKQAVYDVSLRIPANHVTALIGPSIRGRGPLQFAAVPL